MVNTLKIYDLLEQAQIEPGKARAITDAVVRVVEQNNEDLAKTLMTKEDGAKLKADLQAEMHKLHSEILKWMFLFVMGQTAVLAGLIKLLTGRP